VQVDVYSDCSLGEAGRVSESETNQGEFDAGTTRDVISSNPFAVE
jgi:hypothetical protein